MQKVCSGVDVENHWARWANRDVRCNSHQRVRMMPVSKKRGMRIIHMKLDVSCSFSLDRAS